MKEAPRCEAVIYKRDTYRRTGRGRNGLELHFTRCQCSRVAVAGGLCRQHAEIAQTRNVMRVRTP